jgi:hypothetical protein
LYKETAYYFDFDIISQSDSDTNDFKYESNILDSYILFGTCNFVDLSVQDAMLIKPRVVKLDPLNTTCSTVLRKIGFLDSQINLYNLRT